MGNTQEIQKTTLLYDSTIEHKRAAQSESGNDLSVQTQQDNDNDNDNDNGNDNAKANAKAKAKELLSSVETDSTKIEATNPPDGGSTAWIVVLGAWCCSFSSPGWVNSVGSFQQYYEDEILRNYSSSVIAWISSLQIFLLFALGPAVGVLFDRYGPRPLITGGTLLHVFGLMMASLSTKYYQLVLSQGICSAIGVAFIYQPAVACVSTWFSKKRGAAMGILSTGSSVGGVIYPIMISRMVPTVGYPWTMRTAAFIILSLQCIAILTVRPRTKPVPKSMPVGRYTAPFKEVPFVLLMLGLCVLTFGSFLPLTFLAEEAYQEAHVSEEMAQYLVSIFNAASLFGRLSTGFLADIIGRWNMFIIASTLSGIAELAVWIPATKLSIAIGFVVFFSFASGAFIGLSGALPVSVSPASEIGYRLGMVYLAFSIPALAIGPLGGAIIQSSSDGWLNVKVFGGVMCLAGSIITLGSRLLYTNKKIFKVF